MVPIRLPHRPYPTHLRAKDPTVLLPSPRPPRPSTRFSGWRIVALAAVAVGMTAPGQTVGMSVFVDPMMAALDLTRTEVSAAYLVGTITGSTMLPRLGRVIDDRGTRFAMALMGGLFGVALMAMSGVVGLVTLVLGFTGIRMLGQGGLTLVAGTAAAPWFDRRRGLAMGVKGAIGQSLMSMVPLAVGALVLPFLGWRLSWVVLALAVWAVVLPIAGFGIINRPADVGQRPDGTPAPTDGSASDDDVPAASYSRGQAMRTAMFWAVTAGVAATALVGTGLGFHQISLLGEQGLTPVQAAGNFVPQAIAGFTSTILIGMMVDRLAARWVLLLSMGTLATAMVVVPFLGPGISAFGYGMAVGIAGSSIRVMEAATFPKLYGLAHIGAIRGVVFAASVGGSAFGPLALSIGYDLAGSYVQVLRVLLILPIAIAVFGLLAPVPPRPDHDPADTSR